IYIGFTEWTPTSGDNVWGAYHFWHWFDGYWEALTSVDFWNAMWRTVLITVVCVLVEFLIGFALALLLVKNFRGRGLVTVYFLLPMMVIPAVTGFVFFMIYQVDGPLNQALTLILPGDVSVAWLNDPDLAIWAVMTADIWQWTPLMFLIFLSGLVALPEDQMNAARILGASWFSQMRYLVIPMMKPILLIAVIIRAIEAFKLFDPIIFMTRGGPGTASENISLYLYKQTIVNGRWGYASAVAILILIFVSVVGLRAIKPIEQAQEETLEALVGTDAASGGGQTLEEAIEAEARV
ncbi:MAG TPA: sugar ABC transporter permease, partial [Planctomycetota bacterium]|nr:sugar ABC transporter permease [Planctomycetota bacterium]